MATVGTMHINVKARTSSFDRKMLGVRQTIRKLAVGFINIAKKAALFGAAIGAIAVGAIVAMTKAGLESVDMVTKLSRAMNTGAEGIITLQHAAKLGGVSIEKMDKAIGKMFKNVGEAQMGLGLAKASLDKLGLSADALAKLEADDMFGAISEELSKMTDATERAFHANAIFGRAGLELIPVMLDGAKGIRELREEADLLGITFGMEQGKMVEQANDAWARIGSVWKGLTQQLAIGFAPVLIEIANRIKTMVIEFGGMAQVAEFIVRSFFMAGAGIMDMIKMVTVGWLGLKAAVLQATGEIAEAIGSVFGGDLEWIGQQLQDDAAAIALAMNDKLAEGWDTSKVDDYIRGLREKWKKGMDKPLSGTFSMDEVTTSDTSTSKAPAQKSIQTILGAFKLGGDVGEIVQNQQLDKLGSIDEGIKNMMEEWRRWEEGRAAHLESIKETLKPIESETFIGQAPEGLLDFNEVAEKLVHATDMIPIPGMISEEVEALPGFFNMDAALAQFDKEVSPSGKVTEKILDVEEDSLRVNKDILGVLKTKSGVLQ